MAIDSLRALTINTGSSSIKFALFLMSTELEGLVLSGSLEGIGQVQGAFRVEDHDGRPLVEKQPDLPDHETALGQLFGWLEQHHGELLPEAIGHRVVHGGGHSHPQQITDALLDELDQLAPLAPNHLPRELRTIRAAIQAYPQATQIACFDTAFHRQMPELAQIYPLPPRYREQGVIRYGFHGLSYEYILQELARVAGKQAAQDRVIIAHLGNGASMAATHRGRSLDTTMGYTPAGGLVMSTRTGDLDPGVLIHLLQSEGLDAPALNQLVNQQAGLLGVSGVSSSMIELLEQEQRHPAARLAIDLFCYQARKHLAALAAALGGLDTLVFTAGIGEHSAAIRQRICLNLAFLGIHLEAERNAQHAPVISTDESPVTVRVMATNEQLMIARHCYTVLRGTSRS